MQERCLQMLQENHQLRQKNTALNRALHEANQKLIHNENHVKAAVFKFELVMMEMTGKIADLMNEKCLYKTLYEINEKYTARIDDAHKKYLYLKLKQD